MALQNAMAHYPEGTLPVSLAREIVQSVHDVCGVNCIFVTNARIAAATDESRLGNYHAASAEAMEQQKTIIVEDPSKYAGCQEGIVFPFLFNGSCHGVIGISGSVSEVPRFQTIASKIAEVLLREQLLNVESRSQRSQITYAMRALVTGQGSDRKYIIRIFSSRHLKTYRKYRILLAQVSRQTESDDQTMIEQDIYNTFDETGTDLYVFNFPDEYLLLLEDSIMERSMDLFEELAERYPDHLKIGIGEAVKMDHVPESYQSAQIAVKSIRSFGRICRYDDLGLFALTSDLSISTRQSFLKKTIQPLSEKECDVLRSYFDHNNSLQETSNALFIHRNTLQYQLNHIHEKTGLNPRVFQDAARLYLALLIRDSLA